MLTLPPNAPFSGAQKMWIKGFLDGINSSLLPASSGAAPAAEPALSAGRDVTIAWGSQTGNAQNLGKKLSKTLTAKGHRTSLRDMAELSVADIAATENLLIITSTYGDGEPPDNALALHTSLHADDAPQLSKTNFAVLALGDTNYAEFCKCGHDFHTRLAALGATPIVELVESDVDIDAPYATWLSLVETALAVA